MRFLLMTAMAVLLSADAGWCGEEEVLYSRLQAVGEDGVIGDLPLEHTSVEIAVTGNLQRAVVRQVYGNPFTTPIEAVYVFPLPDDGAVDRMNMYIGDRLITGRIYESDLARTIYEDAIASGQTAGLLEQERPNIFTQSVGNILPGDSITIEISYVAPVAYDDGRYELSFPMVVGPRFIPGGPAGHGGTGWAFDTDQVPDASRITPHVVPEGTRTGYDIDLSVTIEAGYPVGQVRSLNHQIQQRRDGEKVLVRLARREEIPNRDFVLNWTSSSDRIESGLIAHCGDLGGHFMLILQPDVNVDPGDITPKEMFFVVDCSGSMSGQPMEVAKETVRQFVRGMNPGDSFQIIRFSENASGMSRAPLENTPENVERGIEYIDGLYGEGGTMMIEGIRAAVGYPADPERMRFVIFLTDGYIGNEAEILGELQTTLGDNIRLFSVGVGSSPNRYLIEGLAEEGRGTAYYVGLNEDPVSAVTSVYEKLNNPYLVGIDIDWGRLDVTEVYPARIPDLFAGQPLVVVGRYGEPGRGRVVVSGTIAGERWRQALEVELPRREPDNDVIATLWARRKIHELSRLMYDSYGNQSYDQEIVDMITDVALDYRIMSEYTSFVAVCEEVRTVDGRPVTVEVPVNMPEGVSYEGVFGEDTGAIYGSAGLGRTRSSVQSIPSPASGAGGGAYYGVAECEQMSIISADGDYCYGGWEPTPSVTMSSAAPYLGLRASVVRGAFRELTDEIQAVYEEWAETNSDGNGGFPTGSMVFAVEFDAGGRVTDVTVVEDGLESGSLSRAVAAVLRTASLPALQGGGGTVNVTFSFQGV
ncbi:VWA domain-containing protein [Candidatus Fermentibacteria bacterium]|nr:VWA domain-containing protein [Candidatus Fermentibacteria bacterium]